MRKISYKDMFLRHVKDHLSLYIFVSVLFFMGVIFGAIIVNSMTISQKEDLYYYLSQFLDSFRMENRQVQLICLGKVSFIMQSI